MSIKKWIKTMIRRYLRNTGILSIPHVKQFNDYSCGAAVLEMVYKYYDLNDVSQREIYTKSKKFKIGSGNYILKEETLVADAKNRGFFSSILQLNFSDLNDGVDALASFIWCKIPVIVCQQSEINSRQGHFRIVTGVDEKFVFFRDPNFENNAECIRWEHQKFFDHWKADGNMVLGNTLIVITKKGARLPPVANSALKGIK